MTFGLSAACGTQVSDESRCSGGTKNIETAWRPFARELGVGLTIATVANTKCSVVEKEWRQVPRSDVQRESETLHSHIQFPRPRKYIERLFRSFELIFVYSSCQKFLDIDLLSNRFGRFVGFLLLNRLSHP